MKTLLAIVLAWPFVLPPSVVAGPLYGTVRIGGVSPRGVEILVACPSFDQPARAPVTAVADERGSFSLLVPATGRCQMRLRRGNQVGNPFEVFVSNNALRFDFTTDRELNRQR